MKRIYSLLVICFFSLFLQTRTVPGASQSAAETDQARLWCHSMVKSAPENIDIEDLMRRYISQQRQQGLPEWAIKANEAVTRKGYERQNKGFTQAMDFIFWYSGSRFGEEERGIYPIQGIPYVTDTVFDGTDTYQIYDNGIDRPKDPHGAVGSNHADISAGRPNRFAGCGWGRWVFFRNQDINAVIANPTTHPIPNCTLTETIGDTKGIGPDGNELFHGSIRVVRDSRYGGQIVEIDVKRAIPGDGMFRRVLASDFHQKPDGGWFPWMVVDQSIIPNGKDKGKIGLEQSYYVTQALFGGEAHVDAMLPNVQSRLRVADRRFGKPIGYDVSTRWLTRKEAEDLYHKRLAIEQEAKQSLSHTPLSTFLFEAGGILFLCGVGLLGRQHILMKRKN